MYVIENYITSVAHNTENQNNLQLIKHEINKKFITTPTGYITIFNSVVCWSSQVSLYFLLEK